MWQIKQGDCMEIIKNLESGSFDALITDPPYSSGGAFRGDRAKSTSEKYLQGGTVAEYSKHDFEGDTMDQHAWIIYTTEWLKQVRRVVKLSGVFAIFVDWRQLAALTDAVQMSGWIYRGIAVWSKLNPRPQKGRFAAGAEYIVWGSNGPLPPVRNAPILPGVFNYATVNSTKRIHQTEKPLLLMQDIVQICERGGKILDPFCGSGSTLEAAELKGFDSYGIEITDYYAKKSAERLSNIKIQTSLNIKNSEMLEGCTE